jgi:hypothetical protein
MKAAGDKGLLTSVESEILASEAELDAHDDGAPRSDRRGLTLEALQT